MKQLVKLNKRPRRGGREFTYALRYQDEKGKRKCESLGHTDQRKAERQRAQKEKERFIRLMRRWPLQVRAFESSGEKNRLGRGPN